MLGSGLTGVVARVAGIRALGHPGISCLRAGDQPEDFPWSEKVTTCRPHWGRGGGGGETGGMHGMGRTALKLHQILDRDANDITSLTTQSLCPSLTHAEVSKASFRLSKPPSSLACSAAWGRCYGRVCGSHAPTSALCITSTWWVHLGCSRTRPQSRRSIGFPRPPCV